MEDRTSPCKSCTKSPGPVECDNKLCKHWRKWMIARWKEFNNFYEKYYTKGE